MRLGSTTWLMRALRLLPAETAHRVGLIGLAKGLAPAFPATSRRRLAIVVAGVSFPNPIGLAAGFDKNGEAMDGLFGLGFGFVEIGSVTPRPQDGNPKPRIFRLRAERAIVNRMGFPNAGAAAVAARVAGWRSSAWARSGILGINLGKNKNTQDAAADYALGAARFAHLADYLVVNVSSPNTPGLRDLQTGEAIRKIACRVREAIGPSSPDAKAEPAKAESGHPTPLFLKIAPDLDDRALVEIADLAQAGIVDALIVSNTTVGRPDGLRGGAAKQAGGLSGPPLFGPSTHMLRRLYMLTHGQTPLIGVGGVSTAKDAYKKIRAGASLVQLYTAFAYHDPDFISRMAMELDTLLQADGFVSVGAAVGVDARRD